MAWAEDWTMFGFTFGHFEKSPLVLCIPPDISWCRLEDDILQHLYIDGACIACIALVYVYDTHHLSYMTKYNTRSTTRTHLAQSIISGSPLPTSLNCITTGYIRTTS
ncbi:hypothetical protein IAQ61_011083 [Plenodomus lingam]|uniref:uncharacterized protein n=1 Tax=Leptosphaeria maculans TaxID=5022 RepID=UPI0033195DE9|nr:hypothetical protein IAQ61_011083 [Plenodomus lingam]